MRNKILISAYACEPNKGSEPGVGWGWVWEISRLAETWVITRRNNKEVIEDYMKSNPNENLKFIYVDLPKALRFWKKKQRGLYLYYTLWQVLAFFKAKKLHKKEEFDLVWHLTFGNFWLPTFLPFLKAKFIWGPLGGADKIPFPFLKALSFKGKIKEILRRTMLFLLKINPFFLFSLRKAEVILARTKETLNFLGGLKKKKVILEPETGIDKSLIDLCTAKGKEKNEGLVRIVYSGRLIPLKGLKLSLQALDLLKKKEPNLRWKFFIIGEGPEKAALLKMVQKFSIEEDVEFLGALPRDEVIELLKGADIFLFLSLKEGTSWSIIEAMACGLPIVATDVGNNSLLLGDECGFLIKLSTPEQVIHDSFEALKKLTGDQLLRERLGKNCAQRLREFSWERKKEVIKRIIEAHENPHSA